MSSENPTIQPAITRAATSAADEVYSHYQQHPGQRDQQRERSNGKGSANVNVGRGEREISIAAGAVLGVLALTKPISLRGLILGGLGAAFVYRGLKGHCGLYQAMGINTTGNDREQADRDAKDYFRHGIQVEESITIDKPAAELFARWRDLESLPKIMSHLKEVRVIDDKRSHWVAKAPLGMSVEWDARIINEEEGKLIAWQSEADAMVASAGSVRFLEDESGRGTTVKVVLDYLPPAGKVGSMLAKFLGEEPSVQIAGDLRRFKQLMETGEVATNADAQPRGKC
jgi:uncharacterized membrane protein